MKLLKKSLPLEVRNTILVQEAYDSLQKNDNNN